MGALEMNSRLKQLRIRRDLTQDELAKLIDVNRSLVAYWESGQREPTAEHLEKLKKVLRVESYTELFINLDDQPVAK